MKQYRYCILGPASSGCIHQIRLLGHTSFRNRSVHPSSPPRADCPSTITNLSNNASQHHQNRLTQLTSFSSTSSWNTYTRGTHPCDIIGADKNRAIPLSNRHVLTVLCTDQNARVTARLRTQNDGTTRPFGRKDVAHPTSFAPRYTHVTGWTQHETADVWRSSGGNRASGTVTMLQCSPAACICALDTRQSLWMSIYGDISDSRTSKQSSYR